MRTRPRSNVREEVSNVWSDFFSVEASSTYGELRSHAPRVDYPSRSAVSEERNKSNSDCSDLIVLERHGKMWRDHRDSQSLLLLLA